MIKLKGAHFLTVFLMGVLFPAFLGAAELPPYSKYEGPIKPGIVITKENFNTYLPELQKLLPPSQLKWLSMGVKEGLVTMPIVKTTFPRVWTKGQLEATKKHAGAARVGTDNRLLNFVAGIPFPEPKNAQEIAWDANPTLSRSNNNDDAAFPRHWFGMFKGTKYEKHFAWTILYRKYRARTDIPPLGDMPDFTDKGISEKSIVLVTEPDEVKGFIQVRIMYGADVDKTDDNYAYIPAIRRVRRLTGADLTDPLLGSDLIPDDYEVMRQKFDSKMKFRILEHRDFLVPRIYTLMEKRPDYDYKKHGPCFQVEWEIRSRWMLEIMINDPDYAYSKRVLYVDALPLDQGGTFFPSWGESYDQRGRLWRASGPMTQVANKEGFKSFYNWLIMNYQNDHYTTMDGPAPYGKDFDKTYPLKEGDLSIRSLLSTVR